MSALCWALGSKVLAVSLPPEQEKELEYRGLGGGRVHLRETWTPPGLAGNVWGLDGKNTKALNLPAGMWTLHPSCSSAPPPAP